MLVKNCMVYCVKYWKRRNKGHHDKEVQIKREIIQKEKIAGHAKENEPIQVKTFARKSNADMNRSKTERVFRYVSNMQKIIKKSLINTEK